MKIMFSTRRIASGGIHEISGGIDVEQKVL
jgi:hypothetical protein